MTPAMVSNQGAYDAGYAAGVAAERARLFKLFVMDAGTRPTWAEIAAALRDEPRGG